MINCFIPNIPFGLANQVRKEDNLDLVHHEDFADSLYELAYGVQRAVMASP